MSEQLGAAAEESAADENAPGSSPVEAAPVPGPGDPADRELTEVADVMAQVRERTAPGGGDAPTVPDEDEVAALEQAHDALRATLDRVDRGG